MRARGNRQRLVFLNRFFFPDQSATSQILTDLCASLASDYEVHVVCSNQLYGMGDERLPIRQALLGCNVHRLSGSALHHSTLSGRALNYALFYRKARRYLDAMLECDDLVIVKTDPPALAAFLAPVIARKGAHLVNWLQDVYPEVATALGVKLGPLAPILRRLRDQALRAAVLNVTPGALMAEKLQHRGAPAQSFRTIANWCDDEMVTPLPPADNPLRRAWGLEGCFVAGYSGNLGRAHEFDTVLAAARRLVGRNDIRFLFTGAGHHYDDLRRQTQQPPLAKMFVFQPHQPREMLRETLCAADAGLVSLRPELEGYVVPSKFYGILAAGRPVLNVADPDGEVGAAIAQADCGCSIRPGDGQALATAIARLADESSLAARLGRNARALLEARYRRAQAFADWREALSSIAQDIAAKAADCTRSNPSAPPCAAVRH